jgi:asparagine synthase (glutamine-hydrolysing)
MHPAVTEELNDLAIADFLLFYFNQDPATTIFSDVRRLPPAHQLTWSSGMVRLSRYWTLPIDSHVRYRRANEYVEHFSELLDRSVEDRLRTDRIGLLMSGGLDSSSIATVAHQLLSKQGIPFDLRAYTTVYDRLIPDEERYYSGLVAKALGIPIHYQVADDYDLFERWDQHQITHQPEPINGSLAAASSDQFQEIASHGRVLLSGDGGDSVLYPSTSYFFYLLKRLQLGVAIKDVAAYFLSHRRLPQLGVRTKLKGLLKRQPASLDLPAWLDRDFAAQLGLQRRYEQLSETAAAIHPTHAEAYQFLITPYWPFLFEMHEPGVTFSPVEVRYPFFDLRLVNYLLSIPPLPWCLKKEILRAAMRGLLPEPVRLRPKAPLVGSPSLQLFMRRDKHWIKRHLVSSPRLMSFVNLNAALAINETEDPDDVSGLFRLIGLSHWLESLPYNRTPDAGG